jgi:hypothetical protein
MVLNNVVFLFKKLLTWWNVRDPLPDGILLLLSYNAKEVRAKRAGGLEVSARKEENASL